MQANAGRPLDRKELSRLVSGFEKRLERELPGLVGEVSDLTIREEGFITMRIQKDAILKLARALRDKFAFDHLSLISAVDWVDRFELVYHITSYPNYCTAEVKVTVPKEDPKVYSVARIWGGADWHEREAYDMMGIAFEGHPDHRRILLPQDYKYFPLRKDFQMEED
jgi:NADH/F420H2 dehydrogenase subunit C